MKTALSFVLDKIAERHGQRYCSWEHAHDDDDVESIHVNRLTETFSLDNTPLYPPKSLHRHCFRLLLGHLGQENVSMQQFGIMGFVQIKNWTSMVWSIDTCGLKQGIHGPVPRDHIVGWSLELVTPIQVLVFDCITGSSQVNATRSSAFSLD